MKLSNYEAVSAVIKALANIDSAIEECTNIINSNYATKVDSDGIEGILETGYESHFHLYSEVGPGGGFGADMTGCYTGVEMVRATYKVLNEKRIDVLSWLKDNGVDVNE